MLNSVLVIDDDPEMRKMLFEVLSDDGYSVETVEDGKKALKSCEKLAFDVALIDIELPDIKGTDLLTELKKIQPKMIKIIITGHPSMENAMKSVNRKADGYILKPFDITSLLITIRRLIDEKTNEYLQMFSEVERSKQGSPIFKYEHPENW